MQEKQILIVPLSGLLSMLDLKKISSVKFIIIL